MWNRHGNLEQNPWLALEIRQFLGYILIFLPFFWPEGESWLPPVLKGESLSGIERCQRTHLCPLNWKMCSGAGVETKQDLSRCWTDLWFPVEDLWAIQRPELFEMWSLIETFLRICPASTHLILPHLVHFPVSLCCSGTCHWQLWAWVAMSVSVNMHGEDLSLEDTVYHRMIEWPDSIFLFVFFIIAVMHCFRMIEKCMQRGVFPNPLSRGHHLLYFPFFLLLSSIINFE